MAGFLKIHCSHGGLGFGRIFGFSEMQILSLDLGSVIPNIIRTTFDFFDCLLAMSGRQAWPDFCAFLQFYDITSGSQLFLLLDIGNLFLTH